MLSSRTKCCARVCLVATFPVLHCGTIYHRFPHYHSNSNRYQSYRGQGIPPGSSEAVMYTFDVCMYRTGIVFRGLKAPCKVLYDLP